MEDEELTAERVRVFALFQKGLKELGVPRDYIVRATSKGKRSMVLYHVSPEQVRTIEALSRTYSTDEVRIEVAYTQLTVRTITVE